MTAVQSRPPALVASCIFGAVGALLLLIGFVTASTPVLAASGAAGSLSLGSALVWRSQLIDAWRKDHPKSSGRR
ncbi:MAG: hypothetical protein ACRD2W_13060 [Acidimicrobiales bacterium]